MSRAGRYRIVSVVLLALLGSVIALAACSDYGEGERCDSLNNDDDCASGLKCRPKVNVNPPYNSSDRCCPDPATATHPACTQPGTAIVGDAAPVSQDTGPTPDSAVTPIPDASTKDGDAEAGD